MRFKQQFISLLSETNQHEMKKLEEMEMKKLAALFCMLLLLCLAPAAKAEDISGPGLVADSSGIPAVEALFDMDFQTAQRCREDAGLSLYSEDGIFALYLIFDREYGFVTLTEEETGRAAAISTGGMLHFYLDVQACFGYLPQELTISFPTGEAQVNELQVFSAGPLPEWVQRWEKIPAGEADLLLLSTHGDDEQLFFAGLLPWYAGEQGRRVQVVYFTDHRNLTAHRVHEMLDGLWAVGVRDYPVFGPFEDYYTFDLEDAYRFYEDSGCPRQALLSFVTEQLRRYQPLVAVGHDVEGEYGHGMHQLTADLLMQAVEISGDPEVFPEQAAQYGAWQVPKTYLHLYPENPVVMDWDIPMKNGMTAYEASKELGFPCHKSQIRDFAWYFRGADRAADVEKYSPCRYGLYRTTVGEDTGKGDFFQNLEGYKDPPAPTEPPAQTLPPPETTPPTSPEPTNPAPTAEKAWIFIPAVGTALLTILTSFLNTPASKEKF